MDFTQSAHHDTGRSHLHRSSPSNLADFTRFDVARSGEVEIPAFGLDPEEFVGVEASIREERDSWSWFFTPISPRLMA